MNRALPSAGSLLLQAAARRPAESTSPAAVEATAAAVSDEVMREAIERRRVEAGANRGPAA